MRLRIATCLARRSGRTMRGRCKREGLWMRADVTGVSSTSLERCSRTRSPLSNRRDEGRRVLTSDGWGEPTRSLLRGRERTVRHDVAGARRARRLTGNCGAHGGAAMEEDEWDGGDE
jgi:hypothetical protein